MNSCSERFLGGLNIAANSGQAKAGSVNFDFQVEFSLESKLLLEPILNEPHSCNIVLLGLLRVLFDAIS